MTDFGVDRPVTYVLTRERVRPTNRWRADPEWRIVRVIEVPTAEDIEVGVDVRLDLRASDTVLAQLLGIEGPTASHRLTGAPSAGGWAAADGDVGTAWITPFNRVNGATLNATLIAPGQPMTIRQRLGNYTRVTAVTMTQGDRTVLVPVPAPDAAGESIVTAPPAFEPGPIRIQIVGTIERTTRDRRFADTVLMPAAISEITNIAPATVPESFETECRDDLMTIDGEPIAVRVAGTLADGFDGAELEATVCGPGPVLLSAGEHLVEGQDNRRIGLQVDRIVLDAGPGDPGVVGGGGAGGAPAPEAATSDSGVSEQGGPRATVTSSSRLGRDVTVEGCERGCWLILGEGFHEAWTASTDAGSLGEPQLVSGGFNGWWIPPSDGPIEVHVSWTAQRPLTLAISISVAAAIACIVLVVRDRRATRRPHATRSDEVRWRVFGPSDGIRRSAVAAAAWTLLSALFVTSEYAWWGLLGGLAILLTRRIRIAAWVAVGAMVRVAIDVITFVWREHPLAYPGFPGNWEHLHRFGLFIAVSLLVSLLAHHHRPTEFSTGKSQRER
jgi:arabinofuranan 3-O-arabinosyltransferase